MHAGLLARRTSPADRSDFWNSGPFLSLATAGIFACSSIAGKYVAAELAALTIVLMRSLFAMGVLGGIAARRGRGEFRVALRHIPLVFLMGWFGIVGYVWLFLNSLEHTSVANTAIIGSLAPVASALAATLFIGERLPPRGYIGVGLSCCGAILLLSGGEHERAANIEFNRGDLLMLGAVGCSVAYGLIARQMSRFYSATTLTVYMTAGAILLLVVIVDVWDVARMDDLSLRGWLAIAFMGIVSSGLGYMLYNVTVRIIGPTRTSCSVYSATPVFVMLMAAWLFGEPITHVAVLSTLLISCGLYFALLRQG